MKKEQKIWLALALCNLIILLSISGCSYLQPQKEVVPPEKKPDQIGKLTENKPTPEKQVASPEISDGPEKDHRELTMENIVQIYGDTIFRFGRHNPKAVALTFDDGPDHQFTPQILDVLKEYNVQATFFLTGIRTVQAIDILKRIDQEGHEIAHHGYNHLKMSNLTPEEIRGELSKLNNLFQENLGKKSYIFRPPYGALDPELVETVKADGFHIILWDIDTLDWRGFDKEKILTNVLSNLHSGAIILQHSAGGPGEDLTGTVEALPEIIQKLREQGYHFVTISEMFAQEMGLEPVKGQETMPGQKTGQTGEQNQVPQQNPNPEQNQNQTQQNQAQQNQQQPSQEQPPAEQTKQPSQPPQPKTPQP